MNLRWKSPQNKEKNMRKIGLIITFFITMSLGGCVHLAPTYISKQTSFDGYKYVYITPTAERNSVQGETFGGQYGIYGVTSSNSVSPSALIASYMMNRGYICVPEIKADISHSTIVINYGDGNMRYEGLGEHAIEVTLQFINAATNELICIVRADAIGDTDADAIKNATNKCLKEVFEK